MAHNMALKFIQIYLVLSIGIWLRFREKNIWDILDVRNKIVLAQRFPRFWLENSMYEVVRLSFGLCFKFTQVSWCNGIKTYN